jgi:hypothetical protein
MVANLSAFGASDIMGVRMPETIRLTVRVGPVVSAAVVAALTMVAGRRSAPHGSGRSMR